MSHGVEGASLLAGGTPGFSGTFEAPRLKAPTRRVSNEPPISKNCVAHLATHFLPAVSERRSEWPTSDTRERSRAAVAPLGKGSDGGTRRGPTR